MEVFNELLREHETERTAGAGHRTAQERPALPKGLYWRGGVIWLSRVVNGQHYNISTGTANPKLAEQFLADFNLKVFKGEKLGVAARTKTTFADLAGRYLEQGRLGGLRPKTLARYTAVRDHFEKFLSQRRLAGADAAAITPTVIEDYKAWRASTPLNRNGWPVAAGQEAGSSGAALKTLQFELQTVGTFFKHSVQLGILEKNPVERARPIRLKERVPVYLEAPEIEALLKAAASYDEWSRSPQELGLLVHDILLAYLKTGMRLEELRNLEWTDVDFERNQIAVRQEKQVETCRTIELSSRSVMCLRRVGPDGFASLSLQQRQELLGRRLMKAQDYMGLQYSHFDLGAGVLHVPAAVTWNPKTNGRLIPLSPGLRHVLERQPRTNNLVFPDPDGGLWRFKVNRLVKRCAKRAGITKDIHTHTLRHTFATHLRLRGVPLETIKELLGHSDIRDTLIYAHFSPAEAQAAIPKIDFFGNTDGTQQGKVIPLGRWHAPTGTE